MIREFLVKTFVLIAILKQSLNSPIDNCSLKHSKIFKKFFNQMIYYNQYILK